MQRHPPRSWSRRMATAVLAISAIVAITPLSACSTDTPASSSTSPAAGQHLAASDFSTAMKHPGTIVLDVRTPTEFASGHLPQAQNNDIEAADFATRIAALDKNATYAVYCRSGNRSGTALELMTAADFSHVYDLTGGIVAWQNMGGPLSTS
jgi:phage shock protein E